MSSRERVARTLARTDPDRVPVYDKFWFETECAYREQLGRPFEIPAKRAAFDWDTVKPETQKLTLWEIFEMDMCEVAWPDYRLRLIDAEVLEENEDSMLVRDGNFAELRWWKHRMGTPEHVSFGIDTPDKWAKVKHLLTPDPNRVRWHQFGPMYERARAADRYVCYAVAEMFENVKDVLGHEIMLKAMVTWPDWMHDVFNTYTDLAIEMFKIAENQGMVCDGAWVYGDIAYNTGPFMSPAHYREFLQPCHQRLFDEFHRRNMPVIYHSDGDLRLVLDDLLATGIIAFNPLEAKAGMDVRELAPRYGDRCGFVGNIDVRVLATNDLDQVREEVGSKLKATMPYRGFICHSDHSVPPDVKLETYQAVLAQVREEGRYD